MGLRTVRLDSITERRLTIMITHYLRKNREQPDVFTAYNISGFVRMCINKTFIENKEKEGWQDE